MSQSSKPDVLILGGINTVSRHLAALLVPEEGESLVNHLRIVDKYSVAPPTTYIGPQFPKILAKPIVEYQQANLINPAKVEESFTRPEGKSFDYVFDLTGEVRPERQDAVQIEQTCNVARLCGLEAAKRKVRAYVRLQQPFYDCPEKGMRDEKDKQKPTKGFGVWWHETLRILAAIEDLNLVILRPGLVYGPWVTYGYITPAIVIGRVYKYLQEKMSFLWSSSTPMHVVHSDDIAGALLAVARWMAETGRKKGDEVAGEEIWFANDKSKRQEVKFMPDPSTKLIAPLFNIVDDTQQTQQILGQTIATYFGIEFGTLNTIASAWAKLNHNDFVENANEHHMEAWTSIITTSNPPVPNTPLTAYMDASMFTKPGTAFSNDKIKQIIKYQLIHPKFTPKEVGEVIDSFKMEGIWPN